MFGHRHRMLEMRRRLAVLRPHRPAVRIGDHRRSPRSPWAQSPASYPAATGCRCRDVRSSGSAAPRAVSARRRARRTLGRPRTRAARHAAGWRPPRPRASPRDAPPGSPPRGLPPPPGAGGQSTSDTSPTGTVTALSPWNPSTIAPRSRLTHSPSRSRRRPGMPWTTSSFDRRAEARGIPAVPEKRRHAPEGPDLILRDPIELARGHPRHDPVDHGLEGPRRDLARTPHRGDFRWRLERNHRRHQPLARPCGPGFGELADPAVHFRHRALRVHGQKQAAPAIVLDQRLGPPVKHFEPVQNRAERIVLSLNQRHPVHIAPPRLLRRMVVEMIDRRRTSDTPGGRSAGAAGPPRGSQRTPPRRALCPPAPATCPGRRPGRSSADSRRG